MKVIILKNIKNSMYLKLYIYIFIFVNIFNNIFCEPYGKDICHGKDECNKGYYCKDYCNNCIGYGNSAIPPCKCFGYCTGVDE